MNSAQTESAPRDAGVLSKRAILARRFLRNIPAVVGLVVLALVVLFAAFGHLLTPWGQQELDFANTGAAPGEGDHLLGTDLAGADMLAQLVAGSRVSLVLGAGVGITTAFMAAVYGCLIAFNQGRWQEKALLFFLELMILMPSFLMVAILTNGKGGNWVVLMVMLIIFGWMGGARLVRSLTSSLIDREFVKAARYMGVSPFTIITRHLMPNIASQLVLSITTGIWSAILAEVGFSFLGIGVKIPDTSLGLLMSRAADSYHAYPWLFWEPVIMLLLITGPLALINDGLRDAFDPTSRAGGSTRKQTKLLRRNSPGPKTARTETPVRTAASARTETSARRRASAPTQTTARPQTKGTATP